MKNIKFGKGEVLAVIKEVPGKGYIEGWGLPGGVFTVSEPKARKMALKIDEYITQYNKNRRYSK
jgi:hypothetical protein